LGNVSPGRSRFVLHQYVPCGAYRVDSTGLRNTFQVAAASNAADTSDVSDGLLEGESYLLEKYISRQIRIPPKRIKFKTWACFIKRSSKNPQIRRLKKKPRRVLENKKAKVRDRDRDRVRKNKRNPIGIED